MSADRPDVMRRSLKLAVRRLRADLSDRPVRQKNKLVLQLLKGCGMIWRSEKRWLVGMDTPATGALIGTCGSRDGAIASSRLAHRLVDSYGLSQARKTVLPLVNL